MTIYDDDLMTIYDLEKFIIEFGFLKKEEQIAGTYKEYTKNDFFVISEINF